MQKQVFETRVIRGEVEGFGSKITRFPGNRGTRGIKIENEWHNVIGTVTELEDMIRIFPPGTYIRLSDKQNAKGYWDVPYETIREITRSEAYEKSDQAKIEESRPAEVEEVREVLVAKKQEQPKVPFNEEDRKWQYLEISRADVLTMADHCKRYPNVKFIKVPIVVSVGKA